MCAQHILSVLFEWFMRWGGSSHTAAVFFGTGYISHHFYLFLSYKYLLKISAEYPGKNPSPCWQNCIPCKDVRTSYIPKKLDLIGFYGITTIEGNAKSCLYIYIRYCWDFYPLKIGWNQVFYVRKNKAYCDTRRDERKEIKQ